MLLAVAMFTLVAGCGDDDAEKKPDAGNAKPDAGDKDCPASGEPAVEGCPCTGHSGEYCCGVGRGVICERTKVWITFYDSPCHPADEDAGTPSIECR
jgi:hypothetical protein